MADIFGELDISKDDNCEEFNSSGSDYNCKLTLFIFCGTCKSSSSATAECTFDTGCFSGTRTGTQMSCC